MAELPKPTDLDGVMFDKETSVRDGDPRPNHDLQEALGKNEREFGEVSARKEKPLPDPASHNPSQGNGLKSHPLLAKTNIGAEVPLDQQTDLSKNTDPEIRVEYAHRKSLEQQKIQENLHQNSSAPTLDR